MTIVTKMTEEAYKNWFKAIEAEGMNDGTTAKELLDSSSDKGVISVETSCITIDVE